MTPRAIGLVLVVLILASLLVWQVLGPVVPKSSLQLVKIGDSKDHVVAVLGKPHERSGSSWIYRRPLNPGWLEIRFDTNGSVAAINDESALGHSNSVATVP